MKRIETRIYLKLHDAVTIPTLLAGSETWTLTQKEYNDINKMELWALKRMFGLPPTTPTPAVIFATGTLYAEFRVRKRQLMYLYKVLKKEEEHWAMVMLQELKQNKVGWFKNIQKTLEVWDLEIEWECIKAKTWLQWRNEVDEAAERMNLKKLREDCHIKERRQTREKTKTKTIIDILDDPKYIRKPLKIINNISALETRAVIMGRYGMLCCGANFAMGYGSKECAECLELDDIDHRINRCPKYKETNLSEYEEKMEMMLLYSDEIEKAGPVITRILSMWDLEHGRNVMK